MVNLKFETSCQTVLPDRSISIRQKMVENAKIKNWNATFCVIFNRSVEALTSFSFAPLEYTPIQFLALFRLTVSIKKCSNFCGKIAILLFKTLVLQSVLDVVVQFHHVLISRIFCDAVLFQNIWHNCFFPFFATDGIAKKTVIKCFYIFLIFHIIFVIHSFLNKKNVAKLNIFQANIALDSGPRFFLLFPTRISIFFHFNFGHLCNKTRKITNRFFHAIEFLLIFGAKIKKNQFRSTRISKFLLS